MLGTKQMDALKERVPRSSLPCVPRDIACTCQCSCDSARRCPLELWGTAASASRHAPTASALYVPAWTRSAALAASELGKVQGDWIVSGMELGATLECPDDSDTGPARPTALCAHGLSNICKCRYKCECVRVAMNASK